MKTETIATVGSVNQAGPKGPYATAVGEDIEGTITFSLEPPVWQETFYPPEGAGVFLSGIYMHRAGSENKGWRATSARLVKPSDMRRSKTSDIQTCRHEGTPT